MTTSPLQPRLLEYHMCGVSPVPAKEANALLTEWGHYLGPVNRPCRQGAYALYVGDQPVSVAVSASTVSPRVEQYRRAEVVELARLCTKPDEPWASRVMLPLWRELCAPRFCGWEVRAAVAYSSNRRHNGDMYRFDGLSRCGGERGTTRAGGNWGRHITADHPGAGPKTLWIWEYGQEM